MSSKRNQNKKAWAKQRRPGHGNGQRATSPVRSQLARRGPPIRSLRSGPSELDQIGVLIVEEQLNLATTDLAGLRGMATHLPFEPCMSLLSILAGRVETTLNKPAQQLGLAAEFFGASKLVERYRDAIARDPSAHIFGPQPLYTLMRVLVEDAYDAPTTHELSDDERLLLLRAVVASNSAIEGGTDNSVGPTTEDLLAYELQAGGYHSRPSWMEEMTRHRELYRLATEDPELAKCDDYEPVKAWIERSGVSAKEQWLLGFGLGAIASAWDASSHPLVDDGRLTELLVKTGLADRRPEALAVISANRGEFRAAFAELGAEGRRFIWELRPFNTRPFLRLEDGGGVLLLGRPWMLSWLGEGLHYRAMRVAQAEDAVLADGRSNHVQRYTAYAGNVFEAYCLRLAQNAIGADALVMGEQRYGKGGGQKTSDVAILIGEDLVLFEANARRVGAEPLLTGDPMDAINELTKLLVKKINQLGVTVGALLSGAARLPGVDMASVRRMFPVVLAAGHVWQTSNLWSYLDAARDRKKCEPLGSSRVQPLQLVDAGDYEMLLALAAHGSNMAEILARKTSGPYRHRDLAVWLNEDPEAPDHHVRLPAVEATFEEMTAEIRAVFKPED